MNRLNLLALLAAPFLISACTGPQLFEKTALHAGEIQLKQDRHVVKSPLSQFSTATLDKAAVDYLKSPMGPVYVVIGYKQGGKASDHAIDQKLAAYGAQLTRAGVAKDDVIVRSIPLDVVEPVVVVAYETLAAAAPEGCDTTPGLDAPVADERGYDYKIGCGVKGQMAKQIEHPAQLEGVAGLDDKADAERAANVVAGGYRTGKTQAFLPGYVVSSIGGSQ